MTADRDLRIIRGFPRLGIICVWPVAVAVPFNPYTAYLVRLDCPTFCNAPSILVFSTGTSQTLNSSKTGTVYRTRTVRLYEHDHR